MLLHSLIFGNMGATANDSGTPGESAMRTSLDLADQLTVRTADFLRALAVAPEFEALTKH